MKRFLILVVLCFASFPFSALPQDATAAAAIAEKQEAEERSKRLSADVESLIAANAALQKRISRLSEEIKNLREEQARAAASSTVQDDLKRLAEKIQEVDKKREGDKQLILDELAKIGKLLSAGSPRSTHQAVTSAAQVTNSVPDKGYEYVVQKGDTPVSILNDYNAAFKEKGMKTITLKQLMEANPGLKAEKMHVGKKIFVPMPPP